VNDHFTAKIAKDAKKKVKLLTAGSVEHARQLAAVLGDYFTSTIPTKLTVLLAITGLPSGVTSILLQKAEGARRKACGG